MLRFLTSSESWCSLTGDTGKLEVHINDLWGKRSKIHEKSRILPVLTAHKLFGNITGVEAVGVVHVAHVGTGNVSCERKRRRR